MNANYTIYKTLKFIYFFTHRPCILIMDSLNNSINKSKVTQIIREYLTVEYWTKFKQEKTFTCATMKSINLDLPKQTDLWRISFRIC